MQKSDFYYTLPEALIAQTPLKQRSASRMLCVEGGTGHIRESHFSDFPSLLNAGDLLVLNDTQVIPARLYGRKESGGRVEILIERILNRNQAWAHIKASKTPRAGSVLWVENSFAVTVLEKQHDLYRLECHGDEPLSIWIDRVGHIPLPPYIKHEDGEDDRDRYQTVFARERGAVAAPTAGLHFDQPMLDRLAECGVGTACVTLHVGSGTFQPIRENDLSLHTMHAEFCVINAATVRQIEETKKAGGRIVAVGTTVVRTLETAALSGHIKPFEGDTRLFITPGFSFNCVDALLTNFHLPESTLLSLVCAFGGYQPVMQAYAYAVARNYRFFSYGDCMFLTRHGKQ